MAFNAISGTQGSVVIGTTTINFKTWEFAWDQNLPNVNNFSSAFQLLVNGVSKGTINLTGPYDAGNSPLTLGQSATVTVKVNNVFSYQGPVLINNITLNDDIDDAARLKVSCETSGTFVIVLQ
jgi:hypothetical protein